MSKIMDIVALYGPITTSHLAARVILNNEEVDLVLLHREVADLMDRGLLKFDGGKVELAKRETVRAVVSVTIAGRETTYSIAGVVIEELLNLAKNTALRALERHRDPGQAAEGTG